nr:unnamed protein product [Digitaria exilis]
MAPGSTSATAPLGSLERVLGEILARNADAEYLVVKCGLAGATDRATFRAKVPMVSYEDLKPSGMSSGEPKLIPAVKDDVDRRALLHSLVMPVINKYVPGLGEGSGLYFLFVKSDTTTPGGLPARTVMTSLFKSDHFTNIPYDPRRNYTSPRAAVLCEDTSQSTYAQMLCGLCHRHSVRRIGATFAYGLLRAINFLRHNWAHLAADIDAGELISHRVTDPSVREAVAGVLRRPDTELAEFIRGECSRGDWAAIVTRIWPNTKYLNTIATGSMAQYIPALDFYSGGLPIVSTIYGSSESCFGLNLRELCDPSEVSYTIMPNMAYFEFLPVQDGDDGDAGQLVELAGVEAGREYELVVTTYGGLSRYLVGDVLRVTERGAGAPVRAPQERAALRRFRQDQRGGSAPRGRARVESFPGHYVIYWELVDAAAAMDGGVLDRCCLEMEEALGSVYLEARVAVGSIGPLEIRVVAPGTFEELADHSVANGGASVGQYKMPRCVTAPAMVQLLDSRVVSRHLSPASPDWTPSHRLGSTAQTSPA